MPEQPITQATEFDPEDEYRPEPEPEPQSPSWMNGSTRIGIHTSIAGSYVNALEAARKLGCNALQIFSASPRMWQGGSARIPEVDAQTFRARREELRLGPLVIHANYLINLAASQPMLRTRSIQAFHDEIVRAVARAADFDREHGRNGHRGGGEAGRNRRYSSWAERIADWRMPRYGASLCRGIRHQRRGRTGIDDRAN